MKKTLLFLCMGLLLTSFSCKKECISTASNVRIIFEAGKHKETTFFVYSLDDETRVLYKREGVLGGEISLKLNEGNYFVRAITVGYGTEKAFQVQRCKDIVIEL